MITLKIEATKYCNQSCLHCSYSRRYSSDSTHLTIEDLKSQMKSAPSSFNAIITGGEPLLNPQIFEIIQYIHERGAKHIALATNAIPFINNSSLKEKLYLSKVNELIVSLSTSNEDYQKIRQSDQSSVVKEILEIKSKTKNIEITANFLIYSNNLSLVPALISSLESSTFHYVRFLTYNESLAPKQSPLSQLSKDEILTLKSLVKNHNKKINSFFMRIIKNIFSIKNKSIPQIHLINFERDEKREENCIYISPSIQNNKALKIS